MCCSALAKAWAMQQKQFVLLRCRGAITHVNIWYSKAWKFCGSGPWIELLAKKCRCPPEVDHIRLFSQKVTADGVQYNGDKKALKKSGTYPMLLGYAFIEAWLEATPISHEVQTAIGSASWHLPIAPDVQMSRPRQAKNPRQARCPASLWDHDET